MKSLSAFLFGILFALGLALSGMTDPQRVIAFLEVGPHWSENLLFVMGGALLITLVTFPFILRQKAPIFEASFKIQNIAKIDRRLVFGSVIFGIGWGLCGYCPGPLVVGLASLKMIPWVSFMLFLAGQWIARKLVSNVSGGCE